MDHRQRLEWGRPSARAAACLIGVARPLLAGVGSSAREWQPILEVAHVIWNGLVRLQPKSTIGAELRRLFGPRPDVEAVVDLLAARKCELYPDEGLEIAHVIARDSRRRLPTVVATVIDRRAATALRTAV
jgi:hypothetical protein